MIMRGEQSATADGVMQKLCDGPGERDAVVGARAAADLVENDEALGCGVVENIGGLGHFDHEGTLPAAKLVAGAYPSKYAVDDADLCALRGYEASRVGQEGKQCDLANEGRLAAHIRARDEPDLAVLRTE